VLKLIRVRFGFSLSYAVISEKLNLTEFALALGKSYYFIRILLKSIKYMFFVHPRQVIAGEQKRARGPNPGGGGQRHLPKIWTHSWHFFGIPTGMNGV